MVFHIRMKKNIGTNKRLKLELRPFEYQLDLDVLDIDQRGVKLSDSDMVHYLQKRKKKY